MDNDSIEAAATDVPVASSSSAILGWGVTATLSRDSYRRHSGPRPLPGTRQFAMGARVWMLPVTFYNNDRQYVLGFRRGSSGKQLARVIMPRKLLVNWRTEPIYSPAVFRAMATDSNPEFTGPLHYQTREEADSQVDMHHYRVFLAHRGGDWDLMHRADEVCAFCDGRDAFHGDVPLGDNPHAPDEIAAPTGTVGWAQTDRGMWDLGWRCSRAVSTSYVDTEAEDLAVSFVAAHHRELHRTVDFILTWAVGRQFDRLGLAESYFHRIRFITDDRYEPRPLDGIVHLWVGQDGIVTGAQTHGDGGVRRVGEIANV